MASLSGLREAARVAVDSRAWRPAALELLSSPFVARRRNELAGYADRDHLEAAAGWLARAQDARADGGIAGRYHLHSGWSSSYPETTGYIVPTFLALEKEAGLGGFRDRARRCIDFLLGVQLASGAFPGMEIDENRDKPSIFNSAQILNGLTAWHATTGDTRSLDAARRVAAWLVAAQDEDGGWRRHLYGSGKTYTYMAHAACWLAEFGAHDGDEQCMRAARKHLEWVLTHVDDRTGWINDSGFGDEDQRARRGVTHTIAYTIWGTLLLSRILGDARGLAVARRAAYAVARRLELSRWLPGKLDASWKGAAQYACLTGNAQMALVWLELHRLESDPTLVSSACKAIDLVKRAQHMTSRDAGIRGGIGGSDPIWGGYVSLAIPNWAAKFFVDALLAKAATLRELAPRAQAAEPPVVIRKQFNDERPRCAPSRALRVVLLASEASTRVAEMCEAWSQWGFRPYAVVIQRECVDSTVERLGNYVREYGITRLLRRVTGRSSAAGGAPSTSDSSSMNAADYCAAKRITTVVVNSLEHANDLDRIRALEPDLFVYAGCGILRRPALELPRLGTINAHMGLLPAMRGMNVTEWSVMCGVPVGCTVHLIDDGIDTGDILASATLNVDDVRSVARLRERVDSAQIELLGSTVQSIERTGVFPRRHRQATDDGRQYFQMHAELRSIVEDELAGGPRRAERVAPPAALTDGLAAQDRDFSPSR